MAENIFVGRQPMKRGQIDWKTINARAVELMARFHQDSPRNPTGKIEKPKLRRMYGGAGLVAQQNGIATAPQQ